MNRGASLAVQSEWAASKNRPAHLLAVHFDALEGGAAYLNDTPRNIVHHGNTYVGAGDLLTFGGLTESLELRVADVTVELSGVSQQYIAIFLQRQWVDRRLVISQFFLDAALAVIASPVVIHDGRMDDPRFLEDPEAGKSIVQIGSRDQFADFEKLSGRHTNPHDQNVFFPGDRAFDQLAIRNAQSFTWGRIKEPPATGLGAALTRMVSSWNKGDVLSKIFGSWQS